MTRETESYSLEEIVNNDILLRLPVKSLLRFKCACKSWRDLFKSSTFIKKHFDSESNRLRLTVCKFGVNYDKDPPERSFTLFVLPEKIYSGCVPTHQKIYRHDDVSDFRSIYGPIDGLFLLEKGHYIDNVRFGWWNPATKECRVIPRVLFEDIKSDFEDNCRRVGIGMDLVNQDYKIVWLRTFWDDRASDVYPKIYAALYSTKNNSWKYLEPDYPYQSQLCLSQNCTYMNGIYYWLVTSQRIIDEDNVYSVRTFDFATEEFKEMDGPPIPGEHWASLMFRGGSLAAMSSNDVATEMIACYDIWVRIRENNWIKVFTFNPHIPSHWPIGIWGYDKFIFELTETNRLVFYDQTTKEVTSLGFNFFDLGSGYNWSMSYKESLVTIKEEKPTEQDNIDHYFFKH